MENVEKAPHSRLHCMKVNVVWTADIDQLFTFELTSPELHYGFGCVFVSIVIVSWNEVLPVNNTRKPHIITLNAYNYNAHGSNWLGRCQINYSAAELDGSMNIDLQGLSVRLYTEQCSSSASFSVHSFDYYFQQIKKTLNKRERGRERRIQWLLK